MQFTDENNLLVLIETENSSGKTLKLSLFELNLDNTSDTLKVNQLWNYAINNLGKSDRVKAVIFPNSNDKKIILIKDKLGKDQETWLLTIKDSNYEIQKYNFYNIKQTPFSQVNKIIFCNNSLGVALIMGEGYTEEDKVRIPLHFLARNNNKENFIEQELPTQKYFNSYVYYKDLQFDKSGSTCIYIGSCGIYCSEIVLLNKISSKWYLAMHLTDNVYYSLRLTLDEKNIFILKSDTDYKGSRSKNNLEVMFIEDKILTSVPAPVYQIVP